MHEMSLVDGILRILEEQAREQDFTEVRTVWLRVGALSHVDPEALRFCFQAASPGTLAEGAALEILCAPGEGWCMDCASRVTIPAHGAPCPACGGDRVRPTGGDDLAISELEVA